FNEMTQNSEHYPKLLVSSSYHVFNANLTFQPTLITTQWLSLGEIKMPAHCFQSTGMQIRCING
ncbi:hypothetical protein, partial [Idiomarina sp.]|uniref:hypothetical protein n=1 Tax=Idiomarina sp. TaxID=1874361 RepID=UPI00258728E4